MHIGKSTKIGQAKTNMNNVELAKALGVNRYRVSGIRSNRTARQDVIERLAEIFGVSVSEFISWGE